MLSIIIIITLDFKYLFLVLMGIFHMFAIFILCWKGTCLWNHTSIQAGVGKHSDVPLEYGTEFTILSL